MIYVCEPDITDKEINYAAQCIKEGFISGTGGRFVKEFEDKFSKWCNCRYGIATTSGTTALQLIISSLSIGKNDEVIVQSFTNIATCYAVVHNGATPVAIDSEPETWNINPQKIEAKITKKTKAIIVVHIYGHPVDMNPILKIAKKYNLYVIEDAAEAHGATYYGKKIGSLGDAACFSFYANKIITTGEGGMIVTNNKKTYTRAQLLKNLAFSKKKRFLHYHLGNNFRMSNIQAAIGLAQLERIDKFIKRKREIAYKYNQIFKNIPGITLPPEKPWAKNVYWMYGILINGKSGMRRDKIMEKLKNQGIETRQFFIPMHMQPVFKKMGFFKNLRLPVSENLARQGLYLPTGVNLKDKEIEFIGRTLINLMKK
ncbi:MAG: DegT/DnrJ/EryC1/StrS family aminotransferase [Armatimonadetes bacterium]|nr:DegT/DnrJ/EryC1/StrS family aminotransferase [Armatimonadota bacterium]